ncbi:MAG: sigma-70 family RNA polymerase sigma factor [Solirubrobacterales bacterium]
MLEPSKAETAPRAQTFEDVYRSSRDDIYAYVAGLLRDRVAAEDVTALAFERAYRKWDRFDPERGSARGWLFGIARNAALDELRRRKHEAPLTHDPAAPESVEPGADLEREQRVTQALGTLPGADRELISLKFFAGLTNVEIAETTGISPSNVGTRIHRSMTKLRQACQEAENV